MSEEALYNKIDKFCNKTDWSKYPTYEHALEEFIKEIVEEETKELKKENKVLAQNLEDTEILNKTYEKRFNDLEKENAELKKLKRECETSLCRAEYQYNYEQLTKAKELLKELVTLDTYYDWNLQLAHDVEQFLNSEVEKEKPAVQRRELHFDHQAQSYVGE